MNIYPFNFKGKVILDLESTHILPHEHELLEHEGTAGVIFFTRNYQSKVQIEKLSTAIKKINPHLYIGVDHEGGRVQRFRPEFTLIPPMKNFGLLYENNPTEALIAAERAGDILAHELKEVGVDFSFTPVLDLDYSVSTVIGDRAFHHHPATVIELSRAFIAGLHHNKMPAIGKHFPGHGFVAADSHHELPIDDRSFSEIAENDLLPFKALSNVLAGVMPAHVLYSNVDAELAGFSPFWLKKILREECGFQGTIFSDDLTMKATAGFADIKERALKALNAGCDILLVCNSPIEAKKVLNSLPEYVGA